NYDTPDGKFNLLLSRLSGKARDVVKVSLRCRHDLCGDELIDAVFDILKRNFGELLCSNLPMRDFYNTVPRVGPELPDKIGTVKLRQAVTLLPRQEYVVWGKLPPSALVSPGSTVIVEPSSSRSSPRNIMVGRVITPMRECCYESRETLHLLRHWDKLILLDGILYRVSKDPLSKRKRFQFVVPSSLKSVVLSGVHDNAGHQGQPHTLSLARQRFFWHDMEKDDQTAKRVAKKLWDGFFCVYGFPQRIHTDQGANFESELLAELLMLSGVSKSHTSPYHPMGNGAAERFNRTLGNMLRSLPPRSKQKWPQMIQSLTFAHNCTVHETTGFAHFYLMFGRVPRLPVDLMFRNVLQDDTVCDYATYVKSLVDDLSSAMLQAQRSSTKEQKHQSDQYNKRAKGLPLCVGDQNQLFRRRSVNSMPLQSHTGLRGTAGIKKSWTRESRSYSHNAEYIQLHLVPFDPSGLWLLPLCIVAGFFVRLHRCALIADSQNYDTPDGKFNLLLSRLSGKARDVVKVSLRCRHNVCGDELIDAVFDILKRNFGELLCSNLPMRDFYNTVPRVGPELPDKIGTVKLRQAVTLLPRQEYVVWGKLPPSALVSPGSTVIVEPSSSRSSPRNIMVGRVITPMWGDRWIPLKVLNPTNEALTLRSNTKIADVFPCVAAEDLAFSQGLCKTQSGLSEGPPALPQQDPLSKRKRFQFVVPSSLKSVVLSGVHDNAGHQGQPRTLSLARQRFFWHDMEKDDNTVCDYATYVKSLVDDLSSAMLQAQRSSTKEQKHQSDQYNKRAKGLPLCVGDQNYDTPDGKFNLLLSRLSGKARDVVKVSLRCRHNVCGDELIDAVFDILKRNFGELLCSNLPMRDFYNTVPRVGPELPDKIGTVKLRQAVTLLPRQEYVVWGKLPPSALVSPGSTVIVEPSSSRSSPRNIMVGRVITPMWGDRWIPLKVLNPTNEAVTLRSNTKIADVFPCVAAEDLAFSQGLCKTQSGLSEGPPALPQQRFFWHDMEKDVRSHVRNCHRCVLSKTAEPAVRAPLESIKTTVPLELVCIDFWSAEDNNNKSVDVLVITDHFTKLAHAFQCQDQTAKRVAKKLWDGFFCVYGFPQRIHTDQGANFESELLAELLMLSGVSKSHTSPYHPMGNGAAERFNRTLGNMLRSLPPRSKQKWPQMIQSLTFAYNCTVHETTGFAPFYLMFGRVPRLPVDLMFRNVLQDNTVCDYATYVKSLVDDLSSAMLQAQRSSTKEQKHQSDQYNKRAKGLPLCVGDQVLVANKGARGKRKLADKWEPVVYTVVASKPALHIYRIRDTDGNERVVHRNLLLEVNFLPLDVALDGAAEPGDSLAGVAAEPVLHEADTSVADVDAASMCPSLAGFGASSSSSDRTSAWVQQLSPPVLECDAGGGFPEDSVPQHPPTESTVPSPAVPTESLREDQRTTRFGRVIRPASRLIETMRQVTSLFSTRPVPSPVMIM
ncbi:unnamed protein product, partial [Tetraodon nigroviridis]